VADPVIDLTRVASEHPREAESIAALIPEQREVFDHLALDLAGFRGLSPEDAAAWLARGLVPA